MEKFKFLGYEAVKGQDYIGVATVKAYNNIIMKFKIVAMRHTGSIFFMPQSIKITGGYTPCIAVENPLDRIELNNMIKFNCLMEIDKNETGNHRRSDPQETPKGVGFFREGASVSPAKKG